MSSPAKTGSQRAQSNPSHPKKFKQAGNRSHAPQRTLHPYHRPLLTTSHEHRLPTDHDGAVAVKDINPKKQKTKN
jgi:hypothetical protein